MRVLILIACLLQVTLAAPQFVTFEDGKFGVNFGGYHASAGLGGLLTGNAAHGGLSASAGTPWGPKAAAGLGGGVDGRTAGVAFAGAEANPGVGASAILGGSAGEAGFAGSEAHANGNAVSKTLSHSRRRHYSVAPAVVATEQQQVETSIQKIRPPKKYSLISNEHPVDVVHSKHLVKTVHKSRPVIVAAAEPQIGTEINSGGRVDVGSVFNIPIGVLRSLQESLSGLQVEKNVYVKA